MSTRRNTARGPDHGCIERRSGGEGRPTFDARGVCVCGGQLGRRPNLGQKFHFRDWGLPGGRELGITRPARSRASPDCSPARPKNASNRVKYSQRPPRCGAASAAPRREVGHQHARKPRRSNEVQNATDPSGRNALRDQVPANAGQHHNRYAGNEQPLRRFAQAAIAIKLCDDYPDKQNHRSWPGPSP